MPEGGVIQLADAISTPAAAIWYKVAARLSKKPRPTEVRIDCAYLSNVLPTTTVPQFPDLAFLATVGQRNAAASIVWESGCCGALRITYGSEGVNRVLICDIKSQRLYLGACDYVTVEAMRWRSTAWAYISPTISLGADIGDCQGGAYDEATSTHIAGFAAATAISKSMYVPSHALSFTPILTPSLSGGNDLWGGTDPDVHFGMVGGQSVVLSPANYLWTPPLSRFPIFPGGGFYLNVSTQTTVLVSDVWCGATFWLAT